MDMKFLPVELLMNVFLQLDIQTLHRCRQVCKLFRELIDGDVNTQYKIELAVAGLEDGPPSTLTPTDRLALLRERQAAWKALNWRARHEYPMHKGGVWELYGGVLAQAFSGHRKLGFTQLPSVIRGIEEKQWVIEDVGVKIRDFGMDPAQDLLIVLEHHAEEQNVSLRVHLKSLATGAVHPAALKGGIISHPSNGGTYSYTIQTSEDLLGILISNLDDRTSEMLVWNWKTGSLHLHINGDDIPSFAFLTSRYILLAIFPDRVGEEAPPGSTLPQIMVLDLEKTKEQAVAVSDLDYLCTFHYPAMSDTFSTIAMSIRSDPGPSWRPHPSLKVPFHVSRQDRLFVVTLWVTEVHHFAILTLIPSSTFLTHIQSLSPGETKRDFEWSEWGPEGSRLIAAPSTHTSVWVCYVYGMTFAMALRSGSQQVIVTLDFNRLDIRRSRYGLGGEGVQPTPDARLVTEPTAISTRRLFKEEVSTGLPYWLRKTRPFGGEGAEGEGHFEAVMLSEDSLIMVSSQRHIRKYRVLTF